MNEDRESTIYTCVYFTCQVGNTNIFDLSSARS